MYNFLLYAHSWIRWAVLALALVTIMKSLLGTINSTPYTKSDKSLAAAFVGTLHLMFLLGVILYFISPYAFKAFGSEENVMKNATLRFWAVEHVTLMLAGIAVISIGKAKAKKASSDKSKFKKQLIFFGIGLIIVLAGIPWGESARLFRF